VADIQRLTTELNVEENMKFMPYTDTVGKLTIGVGRNLTDNGISRDEAMLMLSNDINKVVAAMSENPIYVRLDAVRQNVLLDMAFNMGVNALSGFHQMWFRLQQSDYAGAADAMLDSQWAKQVGIRSARLSQMMRTGQWPEGI